MNIIDAEHLRLLFKRENEKEIRSCSNPDMVQYHLTSVDDLSFMSLQDYKELKYKLPNFFYQRGLGFIRFYQIGVHEHAANILLAHEYNITYDDAFELSEAKRDEHDSSLMYMYNSVDLWLRLGNRAFFSGSASRTVYAKKDSLNSDELDMFEYDFGYKMEWIE